MPGPILDQILAETKQHDIERFQKKQEEDEKLHEPFRPEGLETIESLMRRRAEKLELDDFIGLPMSSEEVDKKKEEAVKGVPMDKDSSDMMQNFLNKLKG
jgi:predicted CopG family antitoxin